MKKLLLFLFTVVFLNAGVLDDIKSGFEKVKDKVENKVEDVKNSPIDAEFYAKNDSPICKLVIKNISTPKDSNKTIEPIVVEPRRYYRAIVKGLKLGEYEFEYDWYKDKKLIDSSLKTKVLLPIHNVNNKISKKFDLSFLLFLPKECK